MTAAALHVQLLGDADVDSAITSRNSVRAFQGEDVPQGAIAALLQAAAAGLAEPGWKAYVLQGASRNAVVAQVCEAHDALYRDPALAAQYPEAYDYYPLKWVSPYIDRRRENGWGLYGLLGIGKGDKDRMHAQHQRNFRFFDAPVGLMFTLDRHANAGSLVAYGRFLQNVMVAARGQGLDTCPQAAWNGFARIVQPLLGCGADETLVCGMSLGWADTGATVNTFRTPREPVDTFLEWLD